MSVEEKNAHSGGVDDKACDEPELPPSDVDVWDTEDEESGAIILTGPQFVELVKQIKRYPPT